MRKYFEIQLPIRTNEGQSYICAHESFRELLLKIAGGFSQGQAVQGHWRDPADGKVYIEEMTPYYVACDDHTFCRILQITYELFPDQKAIAIAHIGHLAFVTKEAIAFPSAFFDQE